MTMEERLGRTAIIIHHKGVEIIVSDFTGLKGNELAEALKENTRAVAPKTKNKKDWVIVNLFKDCLFDEGSIKYLSKIQKAMCGHFLASANVGLNDIQRMALDIPRALLHESLAVKHFDSEKEAFDWASEYAKRPQDRK